MDPEAAGAAAGSAQKIKLSKLVGGKECKGVKRTKKDGPSLKRLSAPTPTASLGWQRVVVAFAAFALAAEDDGGGQEEERGGD